MRAKDERERLELRRKLAEAHGATPDGRYRDTIVALSVLLAPGDRPPASPGALAGNRTQQGIELATS